MWQPREPGAWRRRLTGVGRLPLSLVVVVALAACSDDERVATGGTTTSVADADQRYEVEATVLESQSHGPQLCLGGVAESYPPQCGGPDIVGWDWAAVDGEESASGTTWGVFHVVGTYVDDVFTLTEPARAPTPTAGVPSEGHDLPSPCAEPDGGWRVLDRATATDAAQQAAAEHATAQDDFAGLWVDQSINPVFDDGLQPGEEVQANDPTKLVLNVMFTGDLERHERELRSLWGGALCVSAAEHTEAELARIQASLTEEAHVLWSSTDTPGNRVEVGVVVDDGLQARLDERYGEGVVVVVPALRPVG